MAESLTTLSSEWGGLNPLLIASFYEVDRNGQRLSGSDITVKAALTDGANLEVSLNWQSPFEQAGPETKAPTLFAMLQSGVIQPLVDSVGGGKSQADSSGDFLKQFEGRTGITKLNSVQVFNGMPPVKLSVTALFRAWKDPVSEVETPFNQLMDWALPVELARDSTLLSNAVNATKGSKDWLEAVLPSKSPTFIAMQYKGRTFAPLVIESISEPLSSAIDKNGKFVELLVPMTLATLSALDRKDWADIQQGSTR
jgi:hypothetical protein